MLFPFSIVYGVASKIRNLFFDLGWVSSIHFDIPIIVVGNLSVGGTGKTPQVEYLIRYLQKDYKIAVLSRGYKRNSKGFVLGNLDCTVYDIGDEPLQYLKKFPKIKVAVDDNRANGIQKLLKLHPEIQIILLDDAYQHRRVKAGFYILLTSYDNIYSSDFMMPMGYLRESRSEAKRADVIIVSKCPKNLSFTEKEKLISKISPSKKQRVFFTTISYENKIYSHAYDKTLSELKKYRILLITGIAKPKPLLEFLRLKNNSFSYLKFSDHYKFKERDIKKIKSYFSKIKDKNKLILTTEKDFMRLSDKIDNVYFLGIKTVFLSNSKDFDNFLIEYIKKNL